MFKKSIINFHGLPLVSYLKTFLMFFALKAIDYNFPDESYKVKREDVEKVYSYFNDILKENIWENTVQGRLKDKKQVDDLVDKVLIKQK